MQKAHAEAKPRQLETVAGLYYIAIPMLSKIIQKGEENV